MNKPKTLNPEALKSYAVRLLGGRALSVAELKQKLRRRAADAGDIDAVVAQLKDYGYLNDSRYAEHFAGSRAAGASYGRQRVLSDLLRKKVAPKVAEKAVAEAFEGVNETERIEEFLARKYRGKNLGAMLKEDKTLASVFRRLRTAGFSSGASIRVLKRHASQAEQLEGMEEGDS